MTATKPDTAAAAPIVVRFQYEARELRCVVTDDNTALEVLDGHDALGAERWVDCDLDEIDRRTDAPLYNTYRVIDELVRACMAKNTGHQALTALASSTSDYWLEQARDAREKQKAAEDRAQSLALKLEQLEGQLDEAFGGDRWRTYSQPILTIARAAGWTESGEPVEWSADSEAPTVPGWYWIYHVSSGGIWPRWYDSCEQNGPLRWGPRIAEPDRPACPRFRCRDLPESGPWRI